jgi:hypothetical protein
MNVATVKVGEDNAKHQLNRRQSTPSFEAAIDSSGNTFLQKNSHDNWKALAVKLNAKKNILMENTERFDASSFGKDRVTTVPSARSPTVDSNSKSSTLTYWELFRQYWSDQYQILLQKLEEDPYSLSLTPHRLSATNEGNRHRNDGNKRSIMSPWSYLLSDTERHAAANHTAEPTIMNTRERFRSIGFGVNQTETNPILSKCYHLIDMIVKFGDITAGGEKHTKNTAHESELLLDRLIASTPRLLAIANAFLILVYMLHGAVTDFFLGPVNTAGQARGAAVRGAENVDNEGVPGTRHRRDAAAGNRMRRQQRVGRERLLGYLLFKVLLLAAVLAPDMLDLLILLLW